MLTDDEIRKLIKQLESLNFLERMAAVNAINRLADLENERLNREEDATHPTPANLKEQLYDVIVRVNHRGNLVSFRAGFDRRAGQFTPELIGDVASKLREMVEEECDKIDKGEFDG